MLVLEIREWHKSEKDSSSFKSSVLRDFKSARRKGMFQAKVAVAVQTLLGENNAAITKRQRGRGGLLASKRRCGR
jgi:hypothetical protein